MEKTLSSIPVKQTIMQRPALADARVCRELTEQELEEVNGGIFPFLGFGAAVIGHTGLMGATGGSIGMAMGFGAHMITGFSLGLASFQLMARYHTRDT